MGLRPRAKRRCLLILLLGLSVSVAVADIRYVAPNGSDSGNNCKNQETPCATINHAISRVSNGDTILVAPGTYRTNAAQTGCTGGAGNSLVAIENRDCPAGCTLSAASVTNPPNVIIDGGNLDGWSVSTCVQGSEGWTIKGLKFVNHTVGIFANGAQELTFEDVVAETKDSGTGNTPNGFYDTDDLTIRRVSFDQRPAWSVGGCDIHIDGKGLFVMSDVQDVLVEDSFFANDNSLGGLSDSPSMVSRSPGTCRTSCSRTTSSGPTSTACSTCRSSWDHASSISTTWRT
jgi:hypothetical protein